MKKQDSPRPSRSTALPRRSLTQSTTFAAGGQGTSMDPRTGSAPRSRTVTRTFTHAKDHGVRAWREGRVARRGLHDQLRG